MTASSGVSRDTPGIEEIGDRGRPTRLDEERRHELPGVEPRLADHRAQRWPCAAGGAVDGGIRRDACGVRRGWSSGHLEVAVAVMDGRSSARAVAISAASASVDRIDASRTRPNPCSRATDAVAGPMHQAVERRATRRSRGVSSSNRPRTVEPLVKTSASNRSVPKAAASGARDAAGPSMVR